MKNKNSLSFVKVIKYNKLGEIVSSSYVDAFKGKCIDRGNIKDPPPGYNTFNNSKVVIKTCSLCFIQYTAKKSAGKRCYSCLYHMYRIGQQQSFKGFPINNRYNEVSNYLKNHPERLKGPIGGWYKARHEESLKILEEMKNAK